MSYNSGVLEVNFPKLAKCNVIRTIYISYVTIESFSITRVWKKEIIIVVSYIIMVDTRMVVVVSRNLT